MSVFNSIITAIFDGYFALAGMLGGEFALWLFSAIAGIVFIFIFKLTSNQKAIRRTKDQIGAGFLEVRLFKEDLGQMMRAQGRIFGQAFKYMSHALKPLMFMIVPVLLMLIQLNMWYGYEPLAVDSSDVPMAEYFAEKGLEITVPLTGNSQALVTVKLDRDFEAVAENISLEASEGLRIVSPAVRVPSRHEVTWRILAVEDGENVLTLRIGDKEITRTVFVGEAGKFHKIQPVLVRGAWAELWNPGKPPLPGDTPVAEFKVDYPEAQSNLFGWKTHWVIVFFILSLIFGFALKGVFGVEI
jgi:uncharacterized membrane protein (DUF106 family)